MISPAASGVTPSISSAINRQILRVLPSTSVADVIQQMSLRGVDSCGLDGKDSDRSQRVSCAVVEEAGAVVGIVTERDIVRLTATKLSLVRSLSEIRVADIMTSPVKTLEESAVQDIFAVLFLFRRYRIRHLPIVDAEGELIGIVTPASIRQVLRPANLLKMRRVADVMSRDVVQAPSNASVMSLAGRMADHRVSCVVIVEAAPLEPALEGDLEGAVMPVSAPVGIVTERDIVQFQALGLDLQKSKAHQVMSSPLFLLDPQDSLWSAHQAMQSHRVRRLVVSWNWGKGLGIVTQTSLLRVFDPIEMCGVIDSLQQTVNQMDTEDDEALPPASVVPSASAVSAQGLLDQAADCLVRAQPQLVNPSQQQQVKQALQLLAQVSGDVSSPAGDPVVDATLKAL